MLKSGPTMLRSLRESIRRGVLLALIPIFAAIVLGIGWRWNAYAERSSAHGGAAPARMALGVATHFPDWPLQLLDTAKSIGARDIRDGLIWRDIEVATGRYEFDAARVAFIDEAGRAGFGVTLLLQGGNPLYDEGHTPYTDAGRAAFGRFATAVLDRFPGIARLEIGNEFNSGDFVDGPVRDAGLSERARFHYLLLKAVYDAVKAKHPNVQVLGGAAHSIPIGYFQRLFALGGLRIMDGLVIHPYTTDPEQFERQIALLRQAMGSEQRPIYATEFSRQLDSEAATANYLVKMATVMQSARIAGADWYALRQEGPPNDIWYKKVALVDFGNRLTTVGRSFRFLQSRVFSQGVVRRVALDPFTYAYAVGERTLVLWGHPRALRLAVGLHAFSATGDPVPDLTAIDADRPIVIMAERPIVIARDVTLAPLDLVADSYDQFNYAITSAPCDRPGMWSYATLAVNDRRFEPLGVMTSGDMPGTPWTPFRGSPYRAPLAIQSADLTSADFGSKGKPNVYKPALRYCSALEGTLRIDAQFDVPSTSRDGIDIEVRKNGELMRRVVGTGHVALDLTPLRVKKGDIFDFVVGPNGSVEGDGAITYRIRLFAGDGRARAAS